MRRTTSEKLAANLSRDRSELVNMSARNAHPARVKLLGVTHQEEIWDLADPIEAD